MQIRLPSSLIVWLAALLLACATLEVNTDFDAHADFARYQRFAWLDPPLRVSSAEVPANEALVQNSLLDKRVRAAVDGGLLARGLEQSDREQAQLLVRYLVGIDEYLKQTGTFVGAGAVYPYGGSGYVSPSFYDGYWTTRVIRDGTLIVDLIDATTQQIVWRGWTGGRNPEGYFSEAQVRESVSRILALFPPVPPAPVDGGSDS